MQMASKNTAKSLLAMLVVLTFLGSVIFGLNWLLADQFEKNALEAERKIPRLVLPEGDTFDLYDGSLVNDVSACYVASNGAGIAVVVDREISHGAIQIMVGVNNVGQITAIAILNQEYTEGNDAKINDPEYLSVYIGRTLLSGNSIAGDYEIDPVAGAEEASEAVYQAVKIAFLQQAKIQNELESVSNKAAEGGN